MKTQFSPLNFTQNPFLETPQTKRNKNPFSWFGPLNPKMDFLSTKPIFSFLSISTILLSIITILGLLASTETSSVAAAGADYTTLIFKGCANQKFQDPSGIYSQNLKTLFQSLISQSSQKDFSSSTSGDGQTALIGQYQCRGDLTDTQCSDCVAKLPDTATKLCPNSVAARVQLTGCYLKYQVVGFNQVSGTQFLYKVCGSTKASGAGFESRRDSAFETLVNGVKNSGKFYTGSYESVYVLGQCDGDLGSGDCVDCVKSGVDSVKKECGDSISGQSYLNKCYISYSYYPNGVPNSSNTPSSSPGTTTTKEHTQRTVAIAVGGVAALGFGIAFLMFIKSVFKKKRSKHNGWG